MNNAVDASLNRIINTLPKFVLKIAFDNELGIANAIHQKVIEEIVLIDCNMCGGTTIQIDLKKAWNEMVKDEAPFTVYRIPPEARDNREIVEVHRLQYTPRNRPAYFSYTGAVQSTILYQHDPRVHLSALDKAQQTMLTSKSGIGGSPTTPHVQLLHGEMIRLHPSPRAHIDWTLTCRVAYDPEMMNLNSEAIDRFAEICTTATKIYCYNNLIENLDIGFIKHGAEISAVKNQIEKWDGLGDIYRDQVTAFSKAASLDIMRIANIIQYAL